ncbi:nucleotidyltransferase family protein [Sediminicola sp. YIK13]|uniref:nucleotidyltransferase family protein n=1 Tax=Sediminicola sp. YIK13 TaxID=1453352 RepID=UPI000785F59F|nr:nucleotidyltransferase family protein [Sediminicola sp. YIK13]
MGSSESKIIVLILAGGKGLRMGTIKQLLPWKGTTLLENAIEQAKMSQASDIIVVLGAHATEIRSKINDKDIQFIDNTEWESGLGTSISCGVNYIQNNIPHVEGVMVLLADQPLIDTQYIDYMLDTFIKQSNGIVATNYGNREGVPAIFDKNYFSDLKILNKDFGAKEIIRKNKHLNISLNPKGKELDIDTPEDYKTLLKEQSK